MGSTRGAVNWMSGLKTQRPYRLNIGIIRTRSWAQNTMSVHSKSRICQILPLIRGIAALLAGKQSNE